MFKLTIEMVFEAMYAGSKVKKIETIKYLKGN